MTELCLPLVSSLLLARLLIRQPHSVNMADLDPGTFLLLGNMDDSPSQMLPVLLGQP